MVLNDLDRQKILDYIESFSFSGGTHQFCALVSDDFELIKELIKRQIECSCFPPLSRQTELLEYTYKYGLNVSLITEISQLELYDFIIITGNDFWEDNNSLLLEMLLEHLVIGGKYIFFAEFSRKNETIGLREHRFLTTEEVCLQSWEKVKERDKEVREIESKNYSPTLLDQYIISTLNIVHQKLEVPFYQAKGELLGMFGVVLSQTILNKVVEIGPLFGGLTSILTHLSENDSIVAGIEINPVKAKTTHDTIERCKKPGCNVQIFQGQSWNPKTYKQVTEYCPPPWDFLFIDGNG